MSNEVPKARDLQADYKAAMIEEYESYIRGGRTAEADDVAAELKLTFGHDVTGGAEKPEPEPPVERAVPEPAETPESPDEPVKRGPGRPRKNPPAE